MKPKVKTWIENIRNGNIKSKTETILFDIYQNTKKKTLTDVFRLRNELNFSHQTITAILSSLEDEGLIELKGETMHENNYYSKIRYAHPDERKILVARRHKAKFDSWVNRGLNDFSDDMHVLLRNALQQQQKKLF